MTKDQVAAIYIDWIGYDPFEDDPGATLSSVSALLREYAAEYAAERGIDAPDWLMAPANEHPSIAE